MTPYSWTRHAVASAALALLLAPSLALAGPGAHGPGGEHLDGPAGHSHAVASDAPRLESHTELFELVATLADDELSILIDRYATNEPVLGAQVEVEAGTLKAVATFHADHGDYAVADAAFLQALARPGQHPLVITVSAGADTDLLDGVLEVGAPVAPTDDSAGERGTAIAVGAAAVLLAGALVAWRLARRTASRRAA
jgi:hypothetical protein